MPKTTCFSVHVAVLFLCLNSAFSQTQSPTNRGFSFDLKNSANTSAGVYAKDGTLIRTLWSGVQFAAGKHVDKWDGRDDNGNTSTESSYEIKVLSNNVKYEWEGARIGNTSDQKTGSSKLRLFEPVRGIAIADGKAYFAGGYNEGWPAQFRVDLKNPNAKTWIGKLKSTDQATDYVATDGDVVYWGGYDPLEERSKPETFVFATTVKADKEVKFSKGVPASMKWGGIYESTISYMNAPNSIISGLAVQKKGKYLFVARSGLNQLQILDKDNGILVQTYSFSGVRKCIVDGDDDLWLVYGNNVEKFNVNKNGSLTSLGIIIAEKNAAALAISPDNNTIIIADMNSQQVKGYNSKTGGYLWTLGQAGGYLTDATVTDNKFYWKDVRHELLTYLTYLPDGSFYVGDVGNLRTQHYSEKRNFIDRIMFLQNVYNTSVDKANPKRVFSDFLEFEVNYNLPMGANNGSWKLVKNWGANFGEQYDQFNKILNITTLKNGRTYGLLRIQDQYFVIELVQGGVIRYTGIELPQRTFLAEDGSKINNPGTRIGVGCSIIKYPLIGFNQLNNPIWSPIAELLASSPSVTSQDPVPWEGFRGDYITKSNNLVYFNYNKSEKVSGVEYHLGAIKSGTNKWLWKTAKGTDPGYMGPFPEDGAFDNGNGVVAHGAGGQVLILGDNIFWGYHGEFWKQSQTNMWNQVDGNTGLFIGQFGVLTSNHQNEEAFEAGAGNVLSGTIVEIDGITYLYHNDESVHAGVHRWKITGLNTVEVQNAVFTNDQVAAEGFDLLEGLVRGVVLKNEKGWNRGSDADEFSIDKWNIRTGVKTYDPFKSPDINIIFAQNSGVRLLTRDLGDNANLASWKLKGKMNFERSAPSQAQLKAQGFVEVLDKFNRIITRFDLRQDPVSGQNIIGNDKIIYHGTDQQMEFIKSYTQPIEISAENGVMSFSFAGFPAITTTNKINANANWQEPKLLRFYFSNTSSADNYVRYCNISEMRFIAKEIPNKLPSVSISSPADKSVFNVGDQISIKVNASDADGSISKVLLYIDNALAGSDLTAPYEFAFHISKAGVYNLVATAYDNKGDSSKSSTIQITGNIAVASAAPAMSCTGTGGLNWDYWSNVTSTNISSIPLSKSPTESKILSSFTTPVNFADNYGARTRGYICPPVSGIYTFFVSGDDKGELWLSTSDNPALKQKIAYFNDWTNYMQFTKYATQKSIPISLVAGQKYYIEALHVEGHSGDNLSVAWTLPNGTFQSTIPGTSLIPFNPNKIPTVSISSPVDKSVFNTGDQLSIKVSATDADGSVSRVLLYVNDVLIGTDLTAPYDFSFTASKAGVYNLVATAYDNNGDSAKSAPIQITGNTLICAGTGGLNWDYWSNVASTNISSIPLSKTPTESKILSSFTTPVDYANYYGARTRGYICPPVSGIYTFFVSGDDKGELWLSTSDNPALKQKIAYFNDWTNYMQFTKYATQKSIPISLVAGQKYYIEALHVEGHSGDNLSVAWTLPNGTFQSPIPGTSLIPFNPNKIPTVSISSPVDKSVFNTGDQLSIKVSATDADGSVSRVLLYVNDVLIGTDLTAPYDFSFTASKAGVYNLVATAYDNNGDSAKSAPIQITGNTLICADTGGLNWDYWSNVASTNISSIPLSKTPTESKILSSFTTPVDFANYYGARTRGYICPPVSGIYTFFVSGDDKGELWLSTSDNPALKQKIAYFNDWTNYMQFTKYATQKSIPISLVAGQKYYIEALHVEGHSGDNLSVAWTLPNGTFQSTIPGTSLIPFTPEANKSSQSRGTAEQTLQSDSEGDQVSNPKIVFAELQLKTYPNPFKGTLFIECGIPENGQYLVQIFNMQGVLIKNVFNGMLASGVSKFPFNGSNLSSGTYICRITSGKKIINKHITLIR